MEIYLESDNVVFGITDNQLKLYVLNKDKTKVRTLEELEKNEGGKEVLNVRPSFVNDLIHGIWRDNTNKELIIKDMHINRKLKLKKIEELKNATKNYIDKVVLKKYKEIYKVDKIYMDAFSQYLFDENNQIIDDCLNYKNSFENFKTGYRLMEDTSVKFAAISDNKGGVFENLFKFKPYFKSFEDLKETEKEMQNIFNKRTKEKLNKLEAKEKTDELLSF